MVHSARLPATPDSGYNSTIPIVLSHRHECICMFIQNYDIRWRYHGYLIQLGYNAATCMMAVRGSVNSATYSSL